MNGSMALQPFAASTRALGRWSTILLGASIPVSIALDNALLASAMLAWLTGLQYRDKLRHAWSNPVYRAALILFVVLLSGTLYGNTAHGDARLYLLKYLDLVFIPLLGWGFLTASNREQGLRLLACGLALVLLISCALKTGLVSPNQWLRGTAESPVVFKMRLTQNILMAYSVFLFAWLYCSAQTRTGKIVWVILIALALANTTLMVEGASGYILLFTLTLLFGWQRARLRGIAAAIFAASMVIAALSVVPGPFQNRINQIFSELKLESTDHPASTSTGFRLEFYRNTLTLIQQQPIFGYGTGGFPAAYAELVKGTSQSLSRNPHNEFMLITIQTGLIGLAAFVWLLWQQWRLAPQLPTPIERGLAQGLVVMMSVICMLNSALLDHTEGLLYAWLTALLYAGLPSRSQPTKAFP
jgi:O-antigen ligase